MPEGPKIRKNLREAFAVTGYMPASVLDKAESVRSDSYDVRVEPGSDEVLMRVRSGDVVEIRTAASHNDEVLVQLILRDNAVVETLIRASASVQGVTRFNDPALRRLTASATAKSITV